MPNDPAPITDAELAELDRLHVAERLLVDGCTVYSLRDGRNYVWFGINIDRNQNERYRDEFAQHIAALHNSYPALRLRLARAEADRAAIRAEVLREAEIEIRKKSEQLRGYEESTAVFSSSLLVACMAAAEEAKAK